MMFGGIFSWLIIGLVIYLMFSRKGGMMGCCGGHHHDSSRHADHPKDDSGHSMESQGEIIDLKKEDYRVKNEA
jgi:hypothetical protein